MKICLAVVVVLTLAWSARAADVLNEKWMLDKNGAKDARSKQPFKAYEVNLVEGKTYFIEMKSSDIDPFLKVETADGTELAFNDDFVRGTTPSVDAGIMFKAPKTAKYRIIATTRGKLKMKTNFTVTIVEK